MIPGEIIPHAERVTINGGLAGTSVSITNTSDVPVHLTAHFHIFEANRRLLFDRRQAWGMRLDVAADESVRIEPGATISVDLVPIAGARIVRGFNAAVNGPLDERAVDESLRGLVERGFALEPR